MKKLKLNLDNLAVESFRAEHQPREQGTVEAHALISHPHPTCYSRYSDCDNCSLAGPCN